MRILLSAFACSPDWGSEPEVGWQTLLAAAREHEVWVLTQPHFEERIAGGLRGHPCAGRIEVVPVAPSMPIVSDRLWGYARLQWEHDRWQRNAAAVAEALHREHDFDVVHHCTLAAYWMRIGAARVPRPLVLGPVGGAVEPPLTLVTQLGVRGALEDAVRAVLRRVVAALPAIRRSRRGAVVVLTQNRETARQFPHARMLPNALCVDLPEVPPVERREATIVHAARLLPWKGTMLAVRAMRHLRSPAVLHVYGEGPEQQRVARAVRRWGLEGRVRLEGKVPRRTLLERVAGAGAVLLPSLHDEGSIAAAEALTLGTPVVCLDHGGPPEVLRQWPQVRSAAVAPAGPGRTARLLAAALDDVLAAPPPVATEPRPPLHDYAAEILGAYREAVAAPPA
jgi:glycosyltransferase involved in cell wall biosynthesis